jgi:UDP-N-acetylmuramoylalanine--D-glutamate ligase
MNIAIIGYGVEGQAALDYYAKTGANITVCDQNTEISLPENVGQQLGPDYLKNLDRFDLVFRSAGIQPSVILAENPQVASKITTTINEFLRVCPTKNVIGITGTKGKGTTSTLIAKMLEADGKQVFLGGNIGLSPFSFLSELTLDSWVVLELSSFQLIDLQRSPHIGVCLMIVPEHLNWHADMAEYTEAKSQLFKNQIVNDIAIYFANNELSQQVASGGSGQKIPYFESPGAEIIDGTIVIDGQTICATSELKLLGEHNWQNACAAVTVVWQTTQNVDAIRSVLTTFGGLEHRLEFVRELGGVRYYDDGFATTPETVQVALRAFTEPKVVILGGSDKGAEFDELAKTVAGSNVRQVILIGNPASPNYKVTAPAIEAALRAQNFDKITSLVRPGGPTMTEIVDAAKNAAHSSDVVLLSTASASFDMFENYKDRANQFKQAVLALA